MKNVKRLLVAVLAVIMVFSFAACGGSGSGDGSENSGDTTALDPQEMIKSLFALTTDLGLDSTLTDISGIEGGTIDEDLVGTWFSPDGEYSYVYNEDGTSKFSYPAYDMDQDSAFTCITVGDKKVLCENTQMSNYDSDGNVVEEPIVSYTSYKVVNDALYMVTIDTLDDIITSTYTSLIMLYKADENGDFSASLAKNPVSPEAFYGEWTDNSEVSLTIDENGMTVKDAPESIGSEPMTISANDKGNIVIECQGVSTEYDYAYSLNREYSQDDPKEIINESCGLNLFYVGADENDRPNLADIMTDWHKEMDTDEFRFSMNLETVH